MEYRITRECAKLLGRTYEKNGTLWLSYPASGAEWEFTGISCVVTLVGDAMCGDTFHSPRYAIEADGVRIAEGLLTESGVRKAMLLGEKPEKHTVRVIKLSESSDSTLGIAKVSCDGEMRPTAELPRRIEWIGDSITCGYGVDGTLEDVYSTAREDATKAYAYLASGMVSAECSLVAFSGYGIISGYTESGVRRTDALVPPRYGTMGDSYGAFAGRENPAEVVWDFTKYRPDLVVINLGTNDSSYCGDRPERHREFIVGYKAFLATVRACNPQARILCALGTMDGRLLEAMETAAREYSSERGDTRVDTLRLTLHDTEKDGVGVDWHPSAASQRKAAEQFAAYMREQYGW